MRNLQQLDNLRLPGLYRYGTLGDPLGGVFIVTSKSTGCELRVIASAYPESGWDHVSVSLANRCPNWSEMEQIKRLFFREDEIAMQLHVPPRDHVNIHPYCLHLWRPHLVPIPLPPIEMV